MHGRLINVRIQVTCSQGRRKGGSRGCRRGGGGGVPLDKKQQSIKNMRDIMIKKYELRVKWT